MPFLKMELLRDRAHIFTKYKIYQIFTYNYVNRKVLNLSEDHENEKSFIAKYG